jgi:glycosyltransferase involved in cell wall biosynthesis
LGPEKIKVIYQGVNEMYFDQISEAKKIEVKTKYHLPDDYIFYLGNLEPRKNVESLILAFENLKNQSANLVIAGGEAWKYKKIYKIWQDSPVKKRIKFLGYVDAADKPALYSLAKIFVYPSIYEGFGLPPLESMACRTPVVSSFNSSLVEAVGSAGLLVDPNNTNELSKAMEQLITDDKLSDLFIEKGLKQVQQFRWHKTAETFINIFKKIT